MAYTVILEQEPDGGYVVHAPARPGCVSQGNTREERAKGFFVAFDYMRPRRVELSGVLKETASFYCHACHYVKVMLDQLIGENSFINERAVEHDSRFLLQSWMGSAEYAP